MSLKSASAPRHTTSRYWEDKLRAVTFCCAECSRKEFVHGASWSTFRRTFFRLAPALNPTCWADTVGPSQSLELAWHSYDPALAISTGLHWLLPRWCDQNHKQAILGQAALSRAADDPRIFERNWRFNRGAQVGAASICARLTVASENGQRWRPHPANAFYVDRLLRTAQAGRIPVFWILTPETPGRREQLEQSGVRATYRKFIAERVDAYACLTVLDGQRLFGQTGGFAIRCMSIATGQSGSALAVAAATKPRLSGEESSTTMARPCRIRRFKKRANMKTW